MFKLMASVLMGVVTLVSSALLNGGGLHNSSVQTKQVAFTQNQIGQVAGNPYADGNLPLGDNKYTTSEPKVGYIYLCNVNLNSGGGANQKGTWIHGNSWNIKEKIKVSGKVAWPNAEFSNSTDGVNRTLAGNDLPSHATGVFPIKSSDPAYKYDKNPNSIKPQSFSDVLPLNPTYSDTPYCMGGEAGIMLTGVALFNGFDAGYRDAAAYEVQDDCNGHPQVDGEYHYHSLSSCITNIDSTNVIGYALDGFPITGPRVNDNKFLTTKDLDVCHGITSQIILDGALTTIYHYVMTEDFPYSVSCFRGKPVSLKVIEGKVQSNNKSYTPPGPDHPPVFNEKITVQPQNRPQPPQDAYAVCVSKAIGENCSFNSPRGQVSGTCALPPNQNKTLCVPDNPPDQN